MTVRPAVRLRAGRFDGSPTGLRIERTTIPDVLVLHPARHPDVRGFFSETWSERWLDALPVEGFVQDNHSHNREAGTIRGLHFQTPPFAQAKLVRAARGAIFDVVVDLREDQPTRGRWVAVVLSAQDGNQLFVPAGCAHGFCTLEDETDVLYKVSAPWAPDHEGGIAWDDPELGIEWPRFDRYVIGDKDRGWPGLPSSSFSADPS